MRIYSSYRNLSAKLVKEMSNTINHARYGILCWWDWFFWLFSLSWCHAGSKKKKNQVFERIGGSGHGAIGESTDYHGHGDYHGLTRGGVCFARIKGLLDHLWCAFLGDNDTYLVIVFVLLTFDELDELLRIFNFEKV